MIPIFILHLKPMNEILPSKSLGELTGELKNLTSSLDLSYEDLAHIERLLLDQLGRNYSLSEYEKDHCSSRYERTKELLKFIDENFNYDRTEREYTEIYRSLNGYRNFLSKEMCKKDVKETLSTQQEIDLQLLCEELEEIGGYSTPQPHS